MRDYLNRTGTYSKKKGGAKVTQPVEGKPTGNRQRGTQQAKEWGDRKRVSQGRDINDVAPAVRRGNGMRPAGIVRNPSPSMYGGNSAPPRAPQGQVTNRPSMFTQQGQGPLPQPQGFGPQPQQMIQTEQPPASAYRIPQGPPPQPQYNPLPQQRGAPPQYQGPQGRYMPPPVNQPMGMNDYQMRVNKWGRKW